MSPSFVSVVIANLNSPVLGEVLGALEREIASTSGSVEVLVVGRDGPGELERFGPRPWLVPIETPAPVSPAAARNLGLARASGDLIASLDADAVPERGWLDALRAAHVNVASPGIVGGAIRIESREPWPFADNLSSFHAYLPDRNREQAECLPCCNLSAPREVFDRVGRFDEGLLLSEDLDWTLRARALGVPLRFEPALVVRHLSLRSSFRAVVEKAFRTGGFSAAVRRRHRLRLPPAAALRILAPVIAFAVTLVAVARHPKALARPRSLAAVLAAKTAWCWGAAA